MSELVPLVDKLENVVSEQEFKMFSGEIERQFFIETMGAKDLDSLLQEFEPDVHNANWEEEYQKKLAQGVYDINVVIRERRAVAFMYAGKMDVAKHYGETELRLYNMGRPRISWSVNQLQQTRSGYVTPWVETGK